MLAHDKIANMIEGYPKHTRGQQTYLNRTCGEKCQKDFNDSQRQATNNSLASAYLDSTGSACSSKRSRSCCNDNHLSTKLTFGLAAILMVGSVILLLQTGPCTGFQQSPAFVNSRRSSGMVVVQSDNNNWSDDSVDSNRWRSGSEDSLGEQRDWQEVMREKQDGTFWSSFEPSTEGEENIGEGDAVKVNAASSIGAEQDADAWLDTLAMLSAEEVQYNMKEADRADKVRQMQEWGFSNEVIANALDVATDLSRETTNDEVDVGMQLFREESYIEEVDLETVESHTRVEVDDETGEPIRSQMVYVDEHTCIGCTNCAMIAQSTFFMHSEHGRARVFQQWGDDDETIQVAIETCPVDCIHYVPYDELKALEIERRDQNINFKARLVSQAEVGNSLSHRVGGANAFTAPQKISGNMRARCSNCPSRGCRDCPMYGVGKNPEYERKEKARKARIAKRKLQEQREREQKSADL